MDFSRFRKRTPRKIHGIKNHLICIMIRGKIKEKKLGRILIIRREKTKIKSKLT